MDDTRLRSIHSIVLASVFVSGLGCAGQHLSIAPAPRGLSLGWTAQDPPPTPTKPRDNEPPPQEVRESVSCPLEKPFDRITNRCKECGENDERLECQLLDRVLELEQREDALEQREIQVEDGLKEAVAALDATEERLRKIEEASTKKCEDLEAVADDFTISRNAIPSESNIEMLRVAARLAEQARAVKNCTGPLKKLKGEVQDHLNDAHAEICTAQGFHAELERVTISTIGVAINVLQGNGSLRELFGTLIEGQAMFKSEGNKRVGGQVLEGVGGTAAAISGIWAIADGDVRSDQAIAGQAVTLGLGGAVALAGFVWDTAMKQKQVRQIAAVVALNRAFTDAARGALAAAKEAEEAERKCLDVAAQETEALAKLRRTHECLGYTRALALSLGEAADTLAEYRDMKEIPVVGNLTVQLDYDDKQGMIDAIDNITTKSNEARSHFESARSSAQKAIEGLKASQDRIATLEAYEKKARAVASRVSLELQDPGSCSTTNSEPS